MNGNGFTQGNIDKVIVCLCDRILHNMSDHKKIQQTENMLRRELIACILGSQVRYEMAKRSLECLEQKGLLHDDWWCNPTDENNQFEEKVYKALSNQVDESQRRWSYRFPKVRAHQIAKARKAILINNLSGLVYNNLEPKHLRKQLVCKISGLGPKQASMFLRNIGFSYNLAILDTNVLHYMERRNMICDTKYNISTIASYERVEQIITNYSTTLGYPVGFLDLVIWATMKAAKEINYEYC